MADIWGITKINADYSGGVKWYNKWNDGVLRTIQGKGTSQVNKMAGDSFTDFHCLSYSQEGNQIRVYGNGKAKMQGDHPRLYVGDGTKTFNNIEMTCYAKLVTPRIKSGSYTTFRLNTRTNHYWTYRCPRDAKGYGSEFFIDQSTKKWTGPRFRKELCHPHYANSSFKSAPTTGHDARLWMGHKFVVQTSTSTGKVTLKCYVDISNGSNETLVCTNGGTWTLVGNWTDTGSNWAVGTNTTSSGVSPANGELTNIEADMDKGTSCKDSRPQKSGSPSMYREKVTRPGYWSYLRTDFVDDIKFKWFSVREIAPLA